MINYHVKPNQRIDLQQETYTRFVEFHYSYFAMNSDLL